ncbi:MAG: GDP-mannose 4,6-dehydratase [Burkholderiales bacterium]|nr:GDP-mannose 4,6-dehydratase [Anaerolineae bacterium]
MRILITGIGGFVGQHLAQHLRAATPDAEIHGTVLDAPSAASPDVLHQIDLKNPDVVRDLIQQLQPQHIYHLAAQAFVPRSFTDPWETLENNIRAELNVILAALSLSEDKKIADTNVPRMLVVTSAEIYGAVHPEELPLTEDTPMRPANPYSVSKVAQDMLALQYHLSHQLKVMRARPFNHIGPGQNRVFVATDFALQIASIEAGLQEPVICTGNLTAQRDFTDVRDIVRAYHLVMEQGTPGEAYNVASGTAHSIQELLNILLGYTSVTIRMQLDTDRLRPVDVPVVRGDATRLTNATGWKPTISFEQTLLDVLNDCRQRVQQSAKHSGSA